MTTVPESALPSDRETLEENEETWTRLCVHFENDIELIRELVDLLEPDLKDHLAQLREAIRHNDPGEVERLAHSLRGAVSNFDASLHMNLLQDLERRGREGNLRDISTLLSQLEEGLRELVIKLRRHLP